MTCGAEDELKRKISHVFKKSKENYCFSRVFLGSSKGFSRDFLGLLGFPGFAFLGDFLSLLNFTLSKDGLPSSKVFLKASLLKWSC